MMDSKCPFCLSRHDSATPVGRGREREVPEDGDASVCLDCGEVSVFVGPGLARREPSAIEIARFNGDPRIANAVAAVLALKRHDREKRK